MDYQSNHNSESIINKIRDWLGKTDREIEQWIKHMIEKIDSQNK